MPGNTESILYDTNGDPLAVDDGVAIPSGTPMILFGGSDGTNSRYVKVDSTGRQILVGAGTAGTPVGGLITIQGDPSGTPLPISGSVTISSGTITVSGTITADQGAPNSVGNGWPVKITDGINILGTNSNPVRIDPTGTTTQPISGTVTANAGTGNFAVVQATAALLNATVTANGNFNNASVSATGSAPPASATYMGGSVTTGSPTYTNGNMNALSLTTAGALRIDGSAVTQPISGTVTANAGTGTFNIAGTVTSNQGTSPWVTNITQFGGSNVATGTGTSGAGIPRVTISNDSNILATQSGSWTVTANQGTAAALSGKWPVQITDGTNTMPTGDAVGRAIFHKITDGTNTAGVDSNNHLFVAGKSAPGVAPTGNPVAVSGIDGGGLKRALLTDTGGRQVVLISDGTNTIGTLTKTLYSDPNGDRRTIHNNATITSSGSSVLTWVGHSEWYMIINLKNAPTGTLPTIQFKIEQLDPIDQTTVLTSERTFTGTLMNAAGVDVIEVPELISDTLKVSWTVTGTSPSWTGVNVTFCGHGAGNAIEGQAAVGTTADDPPIPVAGVDSTGHIQYLNVDDSGRLVVTSQAAAAPTSDIRGGTVILGGGTSGSLNAIRATSYTEQSSNAQRSISSSSTNDSSAGTGARTVKITYLDSTGAGPFTETITMNGTTAVNTVNTNICYIEEMQVITSGTINTNVGVITLFAGTGGTGGTITSIGVGNIVATQGDGRTLFCQHYVPSGVTCNITGFSRSASSPAVFHLRSKPLSTNSSEIAISGLAFVSSTESVRIYGSPILVDGPARILGFGVPSTNGVTMNGSFDYFEN